MLEPFNPLRQYAIAILTGQIQHLRTPPVAVLFDSVGVDNSKWASVILDRQGRYQTELFLIPPEIKEIHTHTHPGIDSFEFHVAGDFHFLIDGESYRQVSNGQPIGDTDTLQQVNADAPHSGTFTAGGSFLSFQYWPEDLEMTSVSASFAESNPSSQAV